MFGFPTERHFKERADEINKSKIIKNNRKHFSSTCLSHNSIVY